MKTLIEYRNMKQMKKLLKLLLIFVFFMIISCESEDGDDADDSSDSTKVESSSDYEWDSSSEISITLNGTSISASSTVVSVSGSTATITAGGCYSVSGTLTNGQIVVYAKNQDVKIKLNGVTVANSSGSPLLIEKAEKAIVFLADGTTNTFTDASSYSNSDISNACIYSKTYLAITGAGILNVTGKYQDGIASADELIINNGIITVTAVDDAIRGKDYLKINDGTIKATSTTGHALKSDNDESTGLGYVQIDGGTMTLASTSGKGIKALNKYIQNDGNITITKSYEGIESANITINGGTLNLIATNDGLNATKGTTAGGTESSDGSSVNITGGTVIANVTNGDALDSNGTLSITGGVVVVNGPSSGDGDGADVNGSFTISGGTVVIAGKSLSIGGMNGSSISGSQPYIKLSGSISSSTLADLRINNTDIITFKPKYGGTSFILSSSNMTKGASYTIYAGGSYSTTANSGGYYSGGTYTAGTSKASGTLSSSGTANTVSL